MERLSFLAVAGQKDAEKINSLLKSIDRQGYNCEGKPEALKGEVLIYAKN